MVSVLYLNFELLFQTCERVFTVILFLIFVAYIAACVGVWMLILNPENGIDSAMDVKNGTQIIDELKN